MMTTTLNRRAALAGALAALPALAGARATPSTQEEGAHATPALVGGACAAPLADPVFAAIERHRAASARWTIALDAESAAETEGRNLSAAEEIECGEASAADEAAYLALLSTPPQTHAGARAQLRYVCDYDIIELRQLELFINTLCGSPFIAGG